MSRGDRDAPPEIVHLAIVETGLGNSLALCAARATARLDRVIQHYQIGLPQQVTATPQVGFTGSDGVVRVAYVLTAALVVEAATAAKLRAARAAYLAADRGGAAYPEGDFP